MIANPLNKLPRNTKDGEVATTCSPISTDVEIVDSLVDVSKAQSVRRDSTLNAAMIPVDGNYSIPFPWPPDFYTPPSMYALSLLYCPKVLLVNSLGDDVGWDAFIYTP